MARIGLGAALIVYVLDQVSKIVLVEHMQEVGRQVVIPGLFNLVMVWNTGISFGIGRDGGPITAWLLAGLALVITVGLTLWLIRMRRPKLALAVGLIIGGALGNATDRVARGAVADFFDFHIANTHWPAFNIADSAIVLGAITLLVDGLWRRRDTNKNEP